MRGDMFGMGDWWVAMAYWANILIVVVCVIYGILNWNKGSEDDNHRSRKGKR